MKFLNVALIFAGLALAAPSPPGVSEILVSFFLSFVAKHSSMKGSW